MFVCLHCGKIFEEPESYVENRGECFGFPSFETWSGSPCCAGGYTEAHRCDCCGEWITDRYVKINDSERYCEDCFSIKELDDE